MLNQQSLPYLVKAFTASMAFCLLYDTAGGGDDGRNPPPGNGRGSTTSLRPDIKDKTNSVYLTQLAQVHMNFGALNRAGPLLRKAIETAKDVSQKMRVQMMLGALLQRKQDWKGAVEQFKAAVGMVPITL